MPVTARCERMMQRPTTRRSLQRGANPETPFTRD
jgi:hypothetical protein